MAVNRSPLNTEEYNEFKKLDAMTVVQRKRENLQLRYLDLKFRFSIHLGKKH